MANGLELKVHRDMRSVEELLPDWSVLWTHCPGAATFQRPEWIFTWMQVFLPSEPFLIEVRQSGVLVGIAPLLIYQRGRERVIGFMGGGVSDYLDILAEPSVSRTVLAEIWNYLNSQEISWDILELCDLQTSSQLFHLAEIAENVEQQQHEECTALRLVPKAELSRWKSDGLHGILPPHKLGNLKNARSRLKRARAELEMQPQIQLATRDTLLTLVDALSDLRARRWLRSGENHEANESIELFYRRAFSRLFDIGVLRLYDLRLAEVIVAVLATFFERNAVYLYLQGFDSRYAWLSPGTQLLGRAIEDAVNENKGAVDFLRGREHYKYSWGVEDFVTYRIRARRVQRPAVVLGRGRSDQVA
ncbi:MAG: GNAT family N-acetyltransferase [Terriglobales bacterium]